MLQNTSDGSVNRKAMDKPAIIFTFPAVMGGVSSFNFNIINNSGLIKNFYTKVILMREASDTRALFTENFNVDEQIVFHYSDRENQYHLQKRLNKLLGGSEGAIVTDNGLTIEAATRFKNPKTIFSLIHDDYYVEQNMRLNNLADIVVAHSSFFNEAVTAADPAAFTGRSFYIPYGVKQLEAIPEKSTAVLNLVFLGRLENEKGVMQLFDIEEGLQIKNIKVSWTIIGKGSLKNDLQLQWKKKDNVVFKAPATTDEVYALLGDQDIFVFPTVFEGTPVSILECLANAVVPVVNDLPGGIRDIVTKDIGFRIHGNDTAQFIDNISQLHHDRKLLQQLQQNCFNLAHGNYDVKKNADAYFELFAQYGSLARKQKSAPRKLVRMDKPFFNNRIVKAIRSLR